MWLFCFIYLLCLFELRLQISGVQVALDGQRRRKHRMRCPRLRPNIGGGSLRLLKGSVFEVGLVSYVERATMWAVRE